MYPISFPLSPDNQRFLQYSYRPDAVRPTMNIAVVAKLNGVLYHRRTLSYRIQDGSGIERPGFFIKKLNGPV